MAFADDFLTPGWSTSTPGDLKNPTALPTKFAKPATVAIDYSATPAYTVVPPTDRDVPQTGQDEAW